MDNLGQSPHFKILNLTTPAKSFLPSKGTYFAGNSKFVPKENVEVEDNYVSNINNLVKNRLSISKLIIKSNYYNYLLK